MKRFQLLSGVLVLVLVALAASCTKEEDSNEPETFTFVVYPGARYLGKVTEVTRQAHKVLKPNEEPPPIAIYDTDAPIEDVANFYAKAYGYGSVAPDNLSSKPPAAYYRGGDLSETKSAAPLLEKLHLSPDVSKAVGTYKAAEIAPKPNRPRVTVQRPYFDVTTSQVVNKTIILMQR
ncbi:MAG TPA: hypothetical protein VLU46_14375 [Thermoanaerobaculia bacterium]|nr:hypothetical protein [Thermoanaerobaculia bacterium]